MWVLRQHVGYQTPPLSQVSCVLLAREHLTHPDSPQDWASFQTALVMTEPHVYSPDGALEHFESERKLLCTHLTGRKRWERETRPSLTLHPPTDMVTNRVNRSHLSLKFS